MASNVGVNVTCNTDCSQWCPRKLRLKCCCLRSLTKSQEDSDDEEEKSDEDHKVTQVCNPIFQDYGKG